MGPKSRNVLWPEGGQLSRRRGVPEEKKEEPNKKTSKDEERPAGSVFFSHFASEWITAIPKPRLVDCRVIFAAFFLLFWKDDRLVNGVKCGERVARMLDHGREKAKTAEQKNLYLDVTLWIHSHLQPQFTYQQDRKIAVTDKKKASRQLAKSNAQAMVRVWGIDIRFAFAWAVTLAGTVTTELRWRKMRTRLSWRTQLLGDNWSGRPVFMVGDGFVPIISVAYKRHWLSTSS